MIDEREKCKSCDVLFVEHVGIIGTCAKLQEAIAILRKVNDVNFHVDYEVGRFLRKVKK